MKDFTSTPEGALIAACALGSFMLALILWRTSQGARMRAQEKARAYAEINRADWEARAARKREARASGARGRARIRGALMCAVALVALGATNLSAHGTLDMIARAGLESIDAQIAVIVVFEMFLAILGGLSLWHMNHGTGFNKYEAGVWAMASLMGGLSWWGAGSVIFALWPLLAAVAWHMVITFGREHKQSAVIIWWRMKRGNATSRDVNAVVTERLITRIVNHAYAANEGARIFRSMRARMYDRAWAQADALGILTPEVRARIQMRIAARYAGARALAPEAVAHMNPWNERASQSARAVRATRPVSAPPVSARIEERAHVESAHAHTDERASEEEARTESADAISHALDAIAHHFRTNVKAMVFAQEYYKEHRKLPTGPMLAELTGLNPGSCRRWLTNTRKELKAS